MTELRIPNFITSRWDWLGQWTGDSIPWNWWHGPQEFTGEHGDELNGFVYVVYRYLACTLADRGYQKSRSRRVKWKEAHVFTVFLFVVLYRYSENVRRPLKESVSESEKIFCGSESEKKVFRSATLWSTGNFLVTPTTHFELLFSSGLCGAVAVFPFDFVRRGVIQGPVKLVHSLSTVPYAGTVNHVACWTVVVAASELFSIVVSLYHDAMRLRPYRSISDLNKITYFKKASYRYISYVTQKL
jgi:hypothetical protein